MLIIAHSDEMQVSKVVKNLLILNIGVVSRTSERQVMHLTF